MIHGVTPGPNLISKFPEVFWGLTTSMWIGNLMLLILNLPLIGMWVKVLKIPYVFMLPNIMIFCVIGAFCMRNTIVDVLIMLAFGIIGYLMKKFEYEPAPLVMAMILGPRLEESLRQALIISGGSFGIFLSSPISIIALGLATFFLFSPVFLKRRPAVGYDEL